MSKLNKKVLILVANTNTYKLLLDFFFPVLSLLPECPVYKGMYLTIVEQSTLCMF